MEVTLINEQSPRERTLKQKVDFVIKYQRGVIVLHAINFLVKITFYSMFTNITIISRVYFNLVDLDQYSSIISSILFGSLLGIGYLLSPITGFLTDTYFGRYKVLVWSTWGMFITTIGYSLVGIVSIYNDCVSEHLTSLEDNIADMVCGEGARSVSTVFLTLILLCMFVFNVFYSGYHANLCIYGAELLEDANEAQKHYYFHLYHFIGVLAALIAGLFVVPFAYQIFPGSVTIYIMVPPSSLAVILVLLRYFKKDFDENTVRLNPIIQISRTTRYAIARASKEKELFTLNSVRVPTSVLDYGKESFGGKYTVEWIQEVKTFYRLIAVFLSFMWFFAIRATTYSIFIQMGLHMEWPGNTDKKINRILVITLIFQFGNIVSLPLIFILNTIVYQYFRRWYPSMLTGIGIGLGCGLFTLFLAIFIELARSELSNCDNNYILSIYYGSRVPIFAILPLYIVLGLGDSFAYATIREFTFAQSPSSMRSLIYGCLQGSRGFGTIVSLILIVLAQINGTCRCNDLNNAECPSLLGQNLGGNCWYYTNCPGKSNAVFLYLLFTLLTLVFLVLYVIAAVNYKKRLTNFSIDEELKNSSAFHHAYKLFTRN